MLVAVPSGSRPASSGPRPLDRRRHQPAGLSLLPTERRSEVNATRRSMVDEAVGTNEVLAASESTFRTQNFTKKSFSPNFSTQTHFSPLK